MNGSLHQYCYPIVRCRAREHSQGDEGTIVLPFRAVPVPKNRAFLKGPDAFKSDWEEWFGCSECGTVRAYSSDDVHWLTMWKPELSDYPSPGNFYSVQTTCFAEGCQEKLVFLVDMKNEAADDLEAKLRRGFFYGMWWCGHRLRPAKEQVQIRRIASLPVRNALRVVGEPVF